MLVAILIIFIVLHSLWWHKKLVLLVSLARQLIILTTLDEVSREETPIAPITSNEA